MSISFGCIQQASPAAVRVREMIWQAAPQIEKTLNANPQVCVKGTQALLAAVRTLAPGHPGELAKELMRALLWQLATTYRQSPVRALGALGQPCH